MRIIPRSENVEPTRKKLRNDSDEPKQLQSNTANADPRRKKLLKETEDPI
jgi:hypothetical protein